MDEPTDPTTATPPVPAHAGLTYAALRLLLMVVVGAVLYLIGLRGVLWLMLTVLVSAGLSFFVLLGQREAAARSLEASMARRRDAARSDRTTAEPPGGAAQPEGSADEALGHPQQREG